MISNAEATKLFVDSKYVELMNSLRPGWGDKMKELIPERMHYDLVAWVCFGERDYGFIDAVAKDSLSLAFREADDDNKERMEDYVKFFYMYTPSLCHGLGASSWRGAFTIVRDEF